jgi:outer membrane protein OmpA-like peptidoglycan-associated protein
LAATVLLATVQGCTSVPDAANPVEWYKGARDWVSGDDANAKAKKAAADAPEIPGKDRPFPKVSSVPEAPARSTAGERQKSAQSLIADRDRARYSDEVIRRQTASATSARTPSAAPRTKAVVDAPPPRSNTEPKVSRTTVSPAPAARPSPPAIPRAAPAPPAAPRAVPAPPPPPALRAEAVPPPPLATRPMPPQPSLAQRPPPPPQPPPAPRVSTAAPAAGTPRTSLPPSRIVFGPPPSDIAIVQNGSTGPVGAAPVPGPLSLDPASQVAIVTFDQGSAKLTSRARRIIREVAEMQRQRGGRLHIVGHSSSWTRDMNLVRHNMINFGLSLDRANVVARELLQLGITGHDLTIGALSDSRPLFFEVMPSGEAGNRRVELYLDGG